MSTRLLTTTAVLALALAVRPAIAQTSIATVASAAGTVEVQRGGGWQPVMVGSQVYLLDDVRTGPNSAAKFLFVDDGVVDLGASTELSLDRYGAPAKGKGPRRALLKLAGGTLMAIVSGYSEEGDRFEVETATAVARVQSTQFVVRYDAANNLTDVIALEGVVAVQGRTGIIGPGVAVGPGETTRVQHGGFPSPVRTLDATQRAEMLTGLRLVGTGVREGLDVGNPIAEGRVVAVEDRPGAAAAGGAEVSYLKPTAPDDPLIDRLSPDIRANSQPLPVYRAVPPNLSPVPPH
jgi:hypothetical protein